MAKSKQRKFSSPREEAKKMGGSFDRTCIASPEGTKWFQFKKAGIYRLDIIPYEQTVDTTSNKPGILYPYQSYESHRGVGAGDNMYICNKGTYGEKCPICEHRSQLSRDPDVDDKIIKELYSKKRQLFNVIDRANPEEGVQVLDISFHLFGKLLKTLLAAEDEDEGDHEKYYYPEEGETLKLIVEEKSFQKNKYFEVKSIEFKPRKEQYEDSIIDDAVQLDTLLIQTPYKKLKDIFLQVDDDDKEDDDEEDVEDPSEVEDEDDTPKPKAGKKKRPPVEEDDDDEDDTGDEDDDGADDGEEDDEPAPARKKTKVKLKNGMEVNHKKYGVCSIRHISPDGAQIKIVDEDGQAHQVPAFTLQVVSEDDAEDDEEKPLPKKKGKPAPVEEDDDEDEDDEPADEDEDEEDDEEDEPAPKKKVLKKK